MRLLMYLSIFTGTVSHAYKLSCNELSKKKILMFNT